MVVKRVVAICGSMQFYTEMEDLRASLDTLGFRVFLPEAEECEDFYFNLPASQKPALKKKFIDAHLEKIRKSDLVLIANYTKREVGGYIGPNTLIEIAFAYALRKKIYLLHPLDNQPCKDEIDGLGVEVLQGSVDHFATIM